MVTPYFPTAAEPNRGHSAYQTLRFLKNQADVEVICPLASYPRAKFLLPRGFRYHRPDPAFRPPDVKTTYFEYPAVPLLSRPFNGMVCAHLLKPYLAPSGPT